MKCRLLRIALILCLHRSSAKILRNNALMSKMVSNFHKDPAREDTGQPRVLGLMQNVLCKNFPSIPCDMITGDKTLNDLIERSIQKIKYKKLSLQKPTPRQPTLQLQTAYPTVNSEELTNYLAVRNNDYLQSEKKKKKPTHPITPKAFAWSADDKKKSHKAFKAKTTVNNVFSGRKKSIRKFYPHKVKYRDKKAGNTRRDLGDYSEEKLSMSVEVPDMTLTKKHQHITYKREPDNPPVWRIDYTKHGDPTLNHFTFDADLMREKMVKTAPRLDESVLEHVRQDVMQPNMYIKKNTMRKTAVDLDSEGMD